MKSSLVLDSLIDQASLALTGLPDSSGRPLNSYSDSFSVLLSLRAISSQLFGYQSPEYYLLDSYLNSFDSKSFVGPLPLGVSNA